MITKLITRIAKTMSQEEGCVKICDTIRVNVRRENDAQGGGVDWADVAKADLPPVILSREQWQGACILAEDCWQARAER